MTNNSKRILIVDDDPQVHKMITTLLAPKNYEIENAENAFLAWDLIHESKPDLVVLDIMMPGMTGIELCEKIRRDEKICETIILMLSAKDTQDDRLKGLEYGADDYVIKPFHVSTLVRKIEHMLEKKEKSNP